MAKHCHECEGKGYVINDLADEDEENLDFIFACIVCKVYESDTLAAAYLSLVTGRELRWAVPPGTEGEKVSGGVRVQHYRPYLVWWLTLCRNSGSSYTSSGTTPGKRAVIT